MPKIEKFLYLLLSFSWILNPIHLFSQHNYSICGGCVWGPCVRYKTSWAFHGSTHSLEEGIEFEFKMEGIETWGVVAHETFIQVKCWNFHPLPLKTPYSYIHTTLVISGLCGLGGYIFVFHLPKLTNHN